MELRAEPTAHGSVIHRNDRCAMEITHLGNGVTVHTVQGEPTVELAAIVIADGALMEEQHGRCVYLVDSLESPSVDTLFRDAMSDWFRSHRRVVSGHMLLGNHMLEMALHVAHLFASRLVMQAYTDVEAWEAVARRESGVATFRRMPLRSGRSPRAISPP